MSYREQKFAALPEYLADAMTRHRVLGAAPSVFADRRQITAGFGATSILHPFDANEHTLFQNCSTTKTCAATLARLIEADKLELDVPAVERLETGRCVRRVR
jgi:CubicO group peptidase (beta-lactamase class C family)